MKGAVFPAFRAFFYQACDTAAHLWKGTFYWEFLPSGPELKWKTKWHKMASAPFPALCSLPTQTGQAEMRPASILICIYPADDPLLSLCRWRRKLHPS